MPARIQLHITLTGHVQGVGLRYAIRSLAVKLECSGTVQNADDGSVVVVLQGSKDDCDQFTHLVCTAAPAADIKTMIIRQQPLRSAFDHFSIIV